MSDSPETTLARSAQRILAALQAPGGTPLFGLHDELCDLRDSANDLLNEARNQPGKNARYEPTERDVAIADLLANPPVYVPHSFAEIEGELAISEMDRVTALDVLSKLSMLDTTPDEVDIASQRVSHFLSGSTYPFRPLPRS